MAKMFADRPFLSALIRDMDREKVNFTSVMHYETELQKQLIPMFMEKLKEFAHTTEIWADVVHWLNVYDMKVRYLCYLRTRDYIHSLHIGYLGYFDHSFDFVETMQCIVSTKSNE